MFFTTNLFLLESRVAYSAASLMSALFSVSRSYDNRYAAVVLSSELTDSFECRAEFTYNVGVIVAHECKATYICLWWTCTVWPQSFLKLWFKAFETLLKSWRFIVMPRHVMFPLVKLLLKWNLSFEAFSFMVYPQLINKGNFSPRVLDLCHQF